MNINGIAAQDPHDCSPTSVITQMNIYYIMYRREEKRTKKIPHSNIKLNAGCN